MKKITISVVLLIGLLVVSFIGGKGLYNSSSSGKTVYAIYPMSGAFAEGGKNARLITEMYFKNNPKSNLSVKYIDSESNPIKAVSAINQAIVSDENPLAISVITSVGAACIPALANKNGFAIAVCALKTKQFDDISNYQFLSYKVEDVVRLPAQFLYRTCDSCVIIYSSEEYGLSGANAFKNTFESFGKNVVGMIPYMIGDSGTREVVEKAMSLDADSIFVVGVPTTGYLNIFRDIKGRGFNGKIASDIVFSSPFIYQALDAVADGIVFVCCDCDLDEPRTDSGKEFRNACLANHITPYYGLVEIYDALLVSDSFVQEKLAFSQETFMNLGQFTGCLGTVKCSVRGEAEYSFCLGTVSNGKIVPVE